MATEELDEDRRTSFDRHAEAYDAIRPSYPAAAIDHLLSATSAGYLIEVGAGTGQATVPFAIHEECSITAIEPGANLARVLRKNVSKYPNVTIAETTFEAWPLDPADLIYSAQAWHWIDPGKRYRKAAHAAPALAILRNEKAPLEPSLRAALDVAYRQWMPSNDDDRIPDQVGKVQREQIDEIAASTLYEAAEVATFPWAASYSTERYLALLSTYSDHAVLASDRREPLYAAIAAAIESHGGVIEIPYVTLVFLARRR